ncbi:hypothetical protein H8B13_11805 [Hymenobacter sp. BT188]|uniref:hypothetical protein n=1 Tax=Hymenobacter sp. BT188 TaxID=2763504 RepID=UPI00165157FB|nr:hypothetical protein [Hymenobacter sp. BT188]MBC6607504.1 hypothetical protein [Hymenobacter sp. BT188]
MLSLQSLDKGYGFNGVSFGAALPINSSFKPVLSGIGKRWQVTKTYKLDGDTTTLAGQRLTPEYWFRLNRFVGVTFQIANEPKSRSTLAYLTQLYGQPRPGNIPGAHYWLGKHTYILYEDISRATTVVHIASLAMLNEQVIETSVRQEARTTLGWQPDSAGLPRQFPVPPRK